MKLLSKKLVLYVALDLLLLVPGALAADLSQPAASATPNATPVAAPAEPAQPGESPVPGSSPAAAPVAAAAKDAVLRGDAKCTACHAYSEKVMAIGKTRHGVNADGRTPTCTSCHGDSIGHAKIGRAHV